MEIVRLLCVVVLIIYIQHWRRAKQEQQTTYISATPQKMEQNAPIQMQPQAALSTYPAAPRAAPYVNNAPAPQQPGPSYQQTAQPYQQTAAYPV